MMFCGLIHSYLAYSYYNYTDVLCAKTTLVTRGNDQILTDTQGERWPNLLFFVDTIP